MTRLFELLDNLLLIKYAKFTQSRELTHSCEINE